MQKPQVPEDPIRPSCEGDRGQALGEISPGENTGRRQGDRDGAKLEEERGRE